MRVCLLYTSCLERTRSFFASIPNDLENKTEKHYQTIFYLLFRLMGQYVESEVKSSVGRADVVVQLQDVVYVFEFKYDGTPEEALAQIDSKQYALSLIHIYIRNIRMRHTLPGREVAGPSSRWRR